MRLLVDLYSHVFHQSKKLPFALSVSVTLWTVMMLVALSPFFVIWYAVLYDMEILKDDLQFVKNALVHFKQLKVATQ